MNKENQNIRLSIVTICYNAELYIEKTIQSILKNKPDWVEYIIIDGASKDKTMDIVDRFQNDIDLIKSETDKGIYDAMNKGQSLAKGEFINFMNAGDCIKETFYTDFDHCYSDQTDIIYGETEYVTLKGEELGTRSNYTSRKLPKELIKRKFLWGQVVSHQSFIPRLKFCQPYDIQYKISADYKWMLDVFNSIDRKPNAKQTKNSICTYLTDGASIQHRNIGLKERYQIMNKDFGWFRNNLFHVLIIAKGIFTKLRKGHLD